MIKVRIIILLFVLGYPALVVGQSLAIDSIAYKDSFCIGDSTQLQVFVSGGHHPYSFKWVPDSGLNNDTIASPVAKPMLTTQYWVTVTDSLGSQVTDSIIICILPPPEVGFKVVSVCFGDSSRFKGNMSKVSSWQWDFGDHSFDTLSMFPVHFYSTTGNYNVKLVATNKYGCRDSMLKLHVVNPVPKAKFSVNDSDQCQLNNSFLFTDSTMLLSGNFSNLWYFGNASTSKKKNPMHTYQADGVYNVKLVVVSDSGCVDSATSKVWVYEMPNSQFKVVSDKSQCLKENKFDFKNESSISNGKLSYIWQFDDGQKSSAKDTSHIYAFEGLYTVRLIAISSNNCIDTSSQHIVVNSMPAADFVITSNKQCLLNNSFDFKNGSTISSGKYTQLWDLGDGTTSSLYSPVYSYQRADTFDVKLFITSDSNCKDTVVKQVITFPMPVASFTVNDPKQCENTNKFVFSNYSYIFNDSISNYYWVFGDKSTDTSENPVHTYSHYDTFGVNLVCESTNGCTDTTRYDVVVYPAPSANFNIDSFQHCLYSNYYVFENISSIAYGSSLSFWSFGDGDSSMQKNPSHTYGSVDTFEVTLIETSNYNCKDMVVKEIYIRPEPIAGFNVDSYNQCFRNNIFKFFDTSIVEYGGFSKFEWYFGDGKISKIQHDSHSYGKYGTYVVKQIVTTTFGCKDSTEKSVTVYAQPKSDFVVLDDSQCLSNNKFCFYDSSYIDTGTYHLTWYFGDSNGYSLDTNPEYCYKTDGVFDVKLKSISDNGCTDSVYKNVYVFPMPEAAFQINDTAQCQRNNEFSFFDLTTINFGTVSCNWNFGDSRKSVLKNPIHSYDTIGEYDVKLLVISDQGCRDSCYSRNIIYPMPVSKFGVIGGPQCLENNSFEYRDSTTIACGIYNLFWFFGDNDSSKQSGSIKHSYLKAGNYDVLLIATSDYRCVDSSYQTIVVHPMPTPSIQCVSEPGYYDCDTVCANQHDMIFETKRNPSHSYKWDVINGYRQRPDTSNPISIRWAKTSGIGSIIVLESNLNTSCQTYDTFSLYIRPDTAPERASVIFKNYNPKTEILICQDFTDRANYQWGYTDTSGHDFVLDKNQWQWHFWDIQTETSDKRYVPEYDYWCIVTYPNGCSTKSHLFGNEVGVKDLMLSSKIVYYPNPATKVLNIIYNAANTGKYRVIVYDINGNMIKNELNVKFDNSRYFIDLNNLSKGVYIFRLLQDNIEVGKFLFMKQGP